jgi:kynurenine formamidase
VLIRVGRDPYDEANPDAPPGPPMAAFGGVGMPPLPGVAPSVQEFLYETSAGLAGADAIQPHDVTLTHMGLPLLDNADLEPLAALCAELGRWEFCFMMAPLNIRGGTGSPVNPVGVF